MEYSYQSVGSATQRQACYHYDSSECATARQHKCISLLPTSPLPLLRGVEGTTSSVLDSTIHEKRSRCGELSLANHSARFPSRCLGLHAIVMSHRNAQPHVSIHMVEVACLQLTRMMMGCTDPFRRGVSEVPPSMSSQLSPKKTGVKGGGGNWPDCCGVQVPACRPR